MLYTLAAYILWGFFPGFFPLLLPASPTEILAHRIVWTAVLVTLYLIATGKFKSLVTLGLRNWLWLFLAGALVTINWGVYVLAVNTQHVADAALGYFINPLVSVALGLIFLKEQLRLTQTIAVGIAAVAVIYLTFFTGQAPYISLALAFSFGSYSLLKKRIQVTSTVSVAAETITMLPLALIYLALLEDGTFLSHGAPHTALLISSGVVTALPLILFAQGAKKIPLATIGMLQYLTPIMQMVWALFINGEHFSIHRWIGFIIIGVAVLLYIGDLARASGRQRLERRKSARA